MDYPTKKEEGDILKQNVDIKDFNDYKLRPVVSSQEIIKMQEMVLKDERAVHKFS